MSQRRYRKNSASDTVKIKFNFNALQTYFEVVDDLGYGSWIKSVLYATFAEHIDLYRVLDQREMYIISTEGDFGGGDFNVPLERVTGAAFAATSIEDVVKWGQGWKRQRRLIGDLYVLETDGFGRRFSHLSDPQRLGIDTTDLIAALQLYGEERISADDGIEMSGLLGKEFEVPKGDICTTGLGCSILLKEWDTFNVYKVVGDRVEKLDEIPFDVQYPVLQTMYAIADPNAKTLEDLMYEGVWGRGVYVTNNLDTAILDADRLDLAVFEVGVTIPEEYSTVFEISRKNTDVGKLGSSLKEGMDGSLNAFVVKVDTADESRPAKSFFVSQTPLDHTLLHDEHAQESIVEQALENNDIDCGSMGYDSIEAWIEAVEPGECEEYDDLVEDMGFALAYSQIARSYDYYLSEAAGLPFSAKAALRLSDTTKLGNIVKRRGYSAIRSRLNSPFDNYVCILDPEDMRSRVIVDLEGNVT
jgi:hypothetical protein